MTLSNGVNQWLSLRFAAPPTGRLRFSAPQSPTTNTTVRDATKEGALCVAANTPESFQFGSSRQFMAEDCLFAGVYAPLNATEDSNLPIRRPGLGLGLGGSGGGRAVVRGPCAPHRKPPLRRPKQAGPPLTSSRS